MVKFLTTGTIAGAIEEILITAKEEIILISPYLKLHSMVTQRLEYAAKNGVPIILVYRKDAQRSKADEAELIRLQTISTLQLYTIKNLHAKCFINENKLVITSMNLLEYSETHNREMGILINKQTERQVYTEAYNEYESIKAASDPVNDLAKKARSAKKPEAANVKHTFKTKLQETGACISCKTEIPFSIFAPYCLSCYTHWANYGKPDCDERFCHMCQKKERTSYNKPLCYDCWTENKNLLPHIPHYHQYKT